MGVFHVFKIVQMLPNRATHHIYDKVAAFGFTERNPIYYITTIKHTLKHILQIKT